MAARAGFSPRQTSAVMRRLGWDGGAPTTLKAAGAQFGYTRERVRQLEQRLVATCAASRVRPREIENALVWLYNVAPVDADVVNLRLGFEPQALLRAATLAGIEPSVTVVTHVVHRSEETGLASRAGSLASAGVRSRGAVRISRLTNELDAPTNRVFRLLAADRRFALIDDSWAIEPDAATPLTRAISKVVGVAGSIALSELSAALERTRQPLAVPEQVLSTICEHLPGIAVEGQQLAATNRLDVGLLAPVERALVAVLRTHGPLLLARDLAEHCAWRGIRRGTVFVYLCRSPLVRPVARGTYSLVGFRGDVRERHLTISETAPSQVAIPG